MVGVGQIQPLASISEAQAFLRIETDEEEAVLAGLIRTASALCEAFLNQVVIEREFVETVPVGDEWTALPLQPVRSILSAAAVQAEGTLTMLPRDAYAAHIDADGRGWVRSAGLRLLLHVTGTAGLAATVNEVPEPIRQGVLRLVAHMFNSRDGTGGEPPAAVTALWRPYRRMRLT